MNYELKKGFLISAPCSGSGKTTVSRALMAYYASRGYKVQPFKCGPDYIDTKFHERVCGRPSVNLDTFMWGDDAVKQLYERYSRDADIAIVEGMMGLYDGYDRHNGSAADIARLLQIPVVMVVDAHAAAYSMAPLLRGFAGYDPRVCIMGVIFNKVGSERHEASLREVCEDVGVKCLGCVRRDRKMEQESRYLGLDYSNDQQSLEVLIDTVKGVVDSLNTSLGIDGTDMVSEEHSSRSITSPEALTEHSDKEELACVISSPDAFSFIYHSTIDTLRKKYGEVVFANPEKDEKIPSGTSFLLIPGGYPEKHLKALSANRSMRESIRDYIEQGGKAQAECGGMMYLCQSIVSDEGEYGMCGVLPYRITSRKADRKLSLGYRRFVIDGVEYRGHEFHYTQFLGNTPESCCKIYDAKGREMPSSVFTYKGLLASYIHIASLEGFCANGNEKDNDDNRCNTASSSPSDRLAPIAFFGTGSDVGKSVVAAGFCRIFKQDGLSPAPFKAQNMALNSYATPEGLEIGRAQAVQAEAAGIPCHTDMNPLLLKPQSDHTSQVVLNGRPIGNQSAYSYFRKEGREPLRQAVCEAFDRLSSRYSPIVMEGAGSISEINLRDTDLVNMPMARHANANVILVADIDRGGVFASVYGSIMLQTPEDRRRIKGIIINKFRGDIRLFENGRRMMEEVCGVPVLGVIPYTTDIHIEEEDSVDLAEKAMKSQHGKVNIAVVLLRHISNFTDFDALEHDPRVHLFYTNNTEEIGNADIIVVPGSKSTIADLYELRRNGCAQAIQKAHRKGTQVIGICGGYQMLGTEILDPLHVEGEIERMPGLGLLPVSTTMSGEKVTQQVCFHLLDMPEVEMQGYEIHMGMTDLIDSVAGHQASENKDGTMRINGVEGAKGCSLLTDIGGHSSGNCMGTYIHGIFDNASFIDYVLRPFAERLDETTSSFDYKAYKEQQYDLLAEHIRKHVDMEKVYEILRSR